MSMPRFPHRRLPQFTQIADVLGNHNGVARLRLRGDSVRVPSKNFQATPNSTLISGLSSCAGSGTRIGLLSVWAFR